jgi:hypothetical protein
MALTGESVINQIQISNLLEDFVVLRSGIPDGATHEGCRCGGSHWFCQQLSTQLKMLGLTLDWIGASDEV